jgi:hypothetical protein
MELCGMFTINHENPDLEGDIATMLDGAKLTSESTIFQAGLPAAGGGSPPPMTIRILEEVAQLL